MSLSERTISQNSTGTIVCGQSCALAFIPHVRTLQRHCLDDTLCDYASARVGRLQRAFTIAFTFAPGGSVPDNLDDLISESVSLHPHGSDHFASFLGRQGVMDPEAIAAARAWFHSNRFLGLELFPDAIDTLRLIRQAPPPRQIGLVTNGPSEVQRTKIELMRLTSLVDFALVSGEFGTAKPDPAIFREALRLGDAQATDAVFIGDSVEFDMCGAHAVGISSIWMNRRNAVWPPSMPPPDAIVRSLTEVLTLIGIRYEQEST